MFDVTGCNRSRFVVGLKRLARLISHRPAGPFMLSSLAAVVTGPANLSGHTHGQFGRINDGLAFFENRSLWQCSMPGAFTVTGFAGDSQFAVGLLLKIDTGGVAAAAFLSQGRLSQSCSW